jgi:hypothetical protein
MHQNVEDDDSKEEIRLHERSDCRRQWHQDYWIMVLSADERSYRRS